MAGTTVATGRAPLTGGKVLAILLGFFVIVFGVNGVMMFDAISTFRGQIAEHPYEAGLKYNAELAAAAAQNARRWSVDVATSEGLRASFRDAEGRPLEGLVVTGRFAAPADVKKDRAFALAETSPGVYAGPAAPSGLWGFELTAKRGGEILFQSTSRLMLDAPALASENAEHWRAALTVAGREALVKFLDSEGSPVAGLAVAGLFEAPKGDRARDRAFTATETRPGVYTIASGVVAEGNWQLVLTAARGGEILFRSRNGVEVR